MSNNMIDAPQGYPSDKNYALSGKIMLSAIVVLIVVVLLIVCLHIYARWYLLRARRRRLEMRRNNRLHHHTHTHTHTHTQHVIFTNGVNVISNGLDASVLKSLPTFTYTNAEKNEKEILECAVCLSEFEEEEKGRVLPKCNHSFHTECIDMWFHSHSTCPICRAEVVCTELPQEIHSPISNNVEVVLDVPASEPALGQGPSSSGSSSSVNDTGRRKVAMLELVVKPRRVDSFRGLVDEEGNIQISPSPSFRSPGGRMRSFKRMLSIRRPSTPPAWMSSGCSSSVSTAEVDLERGGEIDPEISAGQVQR